MPRGNAFFVVLLIIISAPALEHAVTAALVKGRVEGVEVLRVKVVLGDAKSITEITLSNRWEFCLTGKGKL